METDAVPEDRRALLNAIEAAEAIIAEVMAAAGGSSKEALGRAIEDYVARNGEPVFRVDCPRCGAAVFEAPLFYVAARGNWSWMPPAYCAARFNDDDAARRCSGCGRPVSRVHWTAPS